MGGGACFGGHLDLVPPLYFRDGAQTTRTSSNLFEPQLGGGESAACLAVSASHLTVYLGLVTNFSSAHRLGETVHPSE